MALLRRLHTAVVSVFARPVAWWRAQRARRARRLERRLAARVARAGSVDTPKLTLLAMSVIFSQRVPVTRALGGNPSTPRLCLRRLARGPWDVAAAVAGNQSTPQRVLARRFVSSPAWAVQAALGTNPSAPAAALQQMSNWPEAVVRMFVATNPALPSAGVDALLRDPDVYVRAVAAQNPRATAGALCALAKPMQDPAWVLRAVATNPNCPSALGDELLTWIALGGAGTTDPTFDPMTCEGHPGDTAVHPYVWYRNAAMSVNGSDLHPLWRVRSVITSTWPRIPGAVLIRLAVDPQPEVRRSVSGFKELTRARLQHLVHDADPEVAKGALRALKRRRTGLKFWRRPLTVRALAVPVICLVAFAVTHATEPQPGSTVASPPPGLVTTYWKPGEPITAYWNPEVDSGVPEPLPGGGQILVDPLDAQGSGELILSAGSIPLDIQLPVPAFTTLGSSLGQELRLGTHSSMTIVITPPVSPINLLVTTDLSGNVTNTDLPIIYEELP